MQTCLVEKIETDMKQLWECFLFTEALKNPSGSEEIIVNPADWLFLSSRCLPVHFVRFGCETLSTLITSVWLWLLMWQLVTSSTSALSGGDRTTAVRKSFSAALLFFRRNSFNKQEQDSHLHCARLSSSFILPTVSCEAMGVALAASRLWGLLCCH